MRIVILSSSIYGETACAIAVRLAEMQFVPVGVLSLSTLHRATLLRKVGQWGVQGVAGYARAKLFSRSNNNHPQARNPYLQPLLERRGRVFSSLRDISKVYNFPIALCNDQNARESLARLKQWAPDLIVFAGGNILRQQLLAIPRLGVLNIHLGLLPEIRGMSSPEWSLLTGVPVGITIHFMDSGIDTGPVLQRYEYPSAQHCDSLSDLRNQLIAFGVDKIGEVVAALDQSKIVATPQSDIHNDNQFFVMHEWLQARAGERLTKAFVQPRGLAHE
jgi:folate-dependent phosphoribosylglycinamide formyltransferase PurN